jgi:tetratricopeptide (TPR) repeat protein
MRQWLGALAAVALWAGFSQARAETYGQVSFVNSGAPAAQAAFLKGLALLHNFQYPGAARAFQAAEAADPDFALAYWGEAMTYNHAVWLEQDADAGRKALAKLGATPAERLAKAKTPREAAYLHAVETLYGAGTKEERDLRYAGEMAELHRRFPDDVDGTAFYALALLGSCHQGRDFAVYMKSAALLEEVLPSHPDHPGVLHYLIHSYDDPVHAPLGLRAARRYGAVASDSPHALHMTSHIYIAMGMWDEVLDANEHAMKVGNAFLVAHGKGPSWCGHGDNWLVYGYVQEGRLAEADRLIAGCRAAALEELAKPVVPDVVLNPENSDVNSYAEEASRRALETDMAPAELATPPAAYPISRFFLAYARAFAVRKDAAALASAKVELSQAAEELKRLRAAVKSGTVDPEATAEVTMAAEVEALSLLAAGREAEGLERLKAAAAQESATPLEFGPPPVFKPSAELLGDELLQRRRYAEAAEAYRQALARTPGRTRALQGLLAAQHGLGNVEGAAVTTAELARYPRLPAT